MENRPITFRLEIHLFRGRDTEPEVQLWEKVETTTYPNPMLLKAETFEGTNQYLFSLSAWQEDRGIATYFPYATHEKLDLISQLPLFGFQQV